MKMQMLIDEMHSGNQRVIVESINHKMPIVVMNAIIAGTRHEIRTAAFLEGVAAAAKSDTVMLGIPLSKVATASLHLLGQREYDGSDRVIIELIESGFNL